MFTPLITHDLDGAALAAPVDAARRNGAAYKTRTIDDLRIKDDRLRAAIEGTGHLLFDGGMGTMLQAAGMKAGALPELLNFEEPQVITDIQRQYVEAGCDVITANTFGANAHKLDGAATVADVFAAAAACAREAGARYVAGDIGPIGALLRPLGTLSFDEAYDLFAEEVRAGVDAGVDLFIIETMTDLAEIKAAVLACRENSDLPVFATMTFEEDGRTFLGTSPESPPSRLTPSAPTFWASTAAKDRPSSGDSPHVCSPLPTSLLWCRPMQDSPMWTTTATPSSISKPPNTPRPSPA